MPSEQVLNEYVERINTEIARVRDLIQSLIIAIGENDLTPEEVAEKLQPVVDSLSALGNNQPE